MRCRQPRPPKAHLGKTAMDLLEVRSLGFADAFEDRTVTTGAKRLRRARFEARSSLPISAACVVANGVRETLGSLLGEAVALRLFEPSIPAPQAWPTILRDARLYRLRGNVADAAIVLRTPDAVALAAALFGESRVAGPDRALSPIECDVWIGWSTRWRRTWPLFADAAKAVFVERVAEIRGFVTYFELSIEEPVVVSNRHRSFARSVAGGARRFRGRAPGRSQTHGGRLARLRKDRSRGRRATGSSGRSFR